MKIVVIDGQGGRLGKLLVEAVKDRIPQAEVLAVGTNGIATATMQKAGADYVATGENPVVRGVIDADVVLGPLGIVVAHSILGEVTPRMAEAVGGCRGKKILIPMNSCGVSVAGTQEMGLAGYVKLASDQAEVFLRGAR
ncbi:MAG: DUF3842 family protein [Oscillospiraceae bacterium]|nr:DUF3842 family protein [Oscillospiraceae bacterium]